jgi:POT family proton-dependent oligopeptide transporter
MRALLVLYLINYLQFRPGEASSAYKWYTSLVYMTPLIGGFLADRVLGLGRSIVIGGIVMAIGEFCLTQEPIWTLYLGLGLLCLGNGFFKPNISTLVGKMYKPGDARRDGAFSIFYMGINTGGFLAPAILGKIRPAWGFHYAFGAAGVVMVLGVVLFLLGRKRVMADIAAAGNSAEVGGKKAGSDAPVQEEAEAQPRTGGFAGVLSTLMPFVLLGIAVVVPAFYIFSAATGREAWLNVIMPSAFALMGGVMALVLRSIKGAARDRASVVFFLFAFAVLFWMAFEQAGNALNIWAEFNTLRKVGPFEITAEQYQSVNSLFIVACAPLFAIIWTWFEKRGNGIPTPVKVLMTMLFSIACFVCMWASAASENATLTRVKVAAVPPSVTQVAPDPAVTKGLTGELTALQVPSTDKDAPPITVHAGRLMFDKSSSELVVRGTLPPFARMDALRPTVDPQFLAGVGQLEKAVKYAESSAPKTVVFGPLPEGFVMPALENAEHEKIFTTATPVKVHVTPATDKDPMKVEKAADGERDALEVTFTTDLNPLAKATLVGAAASPEWRQAVDEAANKADAARVSGWWLILQYFFATLAELCISPVGLSLVTKLAPVRFAALFMGVWFLTNSVAQYVGGALGEMWGSVTPTYYFFVFIVTSAIGAAVLVPLINPIKKLMHGIR